MRYLVCVLIMAMVAATAACTAQETESGQTQQETTEQSMSADALKNIPFETITGDTTSLADYAGDVVLIVNVASKCGYTPQYTGLEELYREYKDSGFVILGFPANNFGGQEPGTNEEILTFCRTSFDVTFPMMAKVSVKGDDKHPLFVEMTEKSSLPGEIKWNFSKFLIDRRGNLVARFDSGVTPNSEELVGKIRELL